MYTYYRYMEAWWEGIYTTLYTPGRHIAHEEPPLYLRTLGRTEAKRGPLRTLRLGRTEAKRGPLRTLRTGENRGEERPPRTLGEGERR